MIDAFEAPGLNGRRYRLAKTRTVGNPASVAVIRAEATMGATRTGHPLNDAARLYHEAAVAVVQRGDGFADRLQRLRESWDDDHTVDHRLAMRATFAVDQRTRPLIAVGLADRQRAGGSRPPVNRRQQRFVPAPANLTSQPRPSRLHMRACYTQDVAGGLHGSSSCNKNSP